MQRTRDPEPRHDHGGLRPDRLVGGPDGVAQLDQVPLDGPLQQLGRAPTRRGCAGPPRDRHRVVRDECRRARVAGHRERRHRPSRAVAQREPEALRRRAVEHEGRVAPGEPGVEQAAHGIRRRPVQGRLAEADETWARRAVAPQQRQGVRAAVRRLQLLAQHGPLALHPAEVRGVEPLADVDEEAPDPDTDPLAWKVVRSRPVLPPTSRSSRGGRPSSARCWARWVSPDVGRVSSALPVRNWRWAVSVGRPLSTQNTGTPSISVRRTLARAVIALLLSGSAGSPAPPPCTVPIRDRRGVDGRLRPWGRAGRPAPRPGRAPCGRRHGRASRRARGPSRRRRGGAR